MANITLLSDLGLLDASSGIVKGILYNAIPNAYITDVSHDVIPFHTLQAAYILGGAYMRFPVGTAHLVLVDVHYVTSPRLIVAAAGSQYILAPDNGIIPAMLNEPYDCWLCYEHNAGAPNEAWLQAAAAAINELQVRSAAEIGWPSYTPTNEHLHKGEEDGRTVNCSVIYIDNFGNLVTDMTVERFASLNTNDRFLLSVGVDVIDRLSNTYTDVPKGDPLCRFNSRGYMEICVHRGNASALLGFRVGGIYNDIKITFE